MKYDVITVGSATMDAFIETEDANIVSVATKNSKREFMSYPYGTKIEINDFKASCGGGAVNTACNFSKLGFKTSAIIKIGKDGVGKDIRKMIKKYKISEDSIIESSTEITGFSVILVSFQGDRTVLAHRGPNATLKTEEIDFDAIKNSKWLYIAPLNGQSTEVLDTIAEFAENNNVNMAINVGTSSIKRGEKYLKKILETAEVVVMNTEEASMLTKIQIRPDKKTEKYSEELIHPDIRTMMEKLKKTKAKIVVITDGKNGAYAYDGKMYYKCGEFPAKVVSTLGAGDAFASTFVSFLEKTDWDIEKSMMAASVNSASVVEQFSAQDGLLTCEQILKKIENSKDFKVQKISKASLSSK